MAIIIPSRFRRKLHPAIQTLTQSDFLNSWYGFDSYFKSTPYYFPEYTNHGITHINNVLKYADKLIPKSFFDLLDKESRASTISVLVLSILLHDLGMYIRESGIRFLCGMDENHSEDAEEWKDYWEEFTVQMRHASETKLEELYPESEEIKFDISSKSFCAEFIRRHHHRIAYQIAKEGFPGVKLNTMLMNGNLNSEIVRLSGVVAMSHGLDFRKDENELQKLIESFGSEDDLPLDVPVYYLMAVLRIADLLDAGRERAPEIISNMNMFSSPRSEQEWQLNQRISRIYWRENSSQILVSATPKSSIEYVKLKEWFTYWQDELDSSWAVIGEKYDKDYQLTIRRIKDSMERKDLCFVTDAMTLKVNPDIAHLLIEPLYEDQSSYGVRELIQNAVDACNERRVLDPEYKEGSIKVMVDTENGLFTIIDDGIGMTKEVIKDYFLTVGATFRNSSQWCQDYQDDDGNPKFARGGRFGIGALAAFLIGSDVTVTTRYCYEDTGYSFSYLKKAKLLDVKKEKGLPIGTKISIKMNNDSINYFNSDNKDWTEWYRLSKPSITYSLNGYVIQSQSKLCDFIPGVNTDGWFSIDIAEYYSFHFAIRHQEIIYNGIRIKPKRHDNIDDFIRSKKPFPKNAGYYGILPGIAMSDPDNYVTLNLSRDKILTPIYSSTILVKELCKYRIAYALFGDHGHRVYSSRGFILSDLSFILNTKEQEIIYVGPVRFDELKASFDNGLTKGVGLFDISWDGYGNYSDIISGDNVSFSPKVQWLYREDDHFSDSNEPLEPIDEIWKLKSKICDEIGLKISSFYGLFLYRPEIDKVESNLMLEALREYLPYEKNNGWIPYDMKERELMYQKAFSELKKYEDDIKHLEHKPRSKKSFFDSFFG